jgi:hypothetical protein
MIFLVIFLITTLNITNKKEKEMSSYRDYVEENIDSLIDLQMQEQEDNDDKELLSTCCGVGGIGNIHEFDGEHYGLCARCKDRCSFEYEEV